MNQDKLTEIWKQYERGVEYLTNIGRYTQGNTNNNFYIGRQWEGCETGDLPTPVKNIVKPICDFKIATVSQNALSVVYTSANFDDEDLKEVEGISRKEEADKVCTLLTKHVAKVWENNNLDAKQWDIVKEGCVTGDVYAYTYLDDERNEKVELVDDTNIYFSDENDSEIQNQDYILFKSRKPVSQIKEEAKQNGIKQKDIDLIKADEETQEQIGEQKEVKTDEGKCLCILKLYKKKNKDGRMTVHMIKATKDMIYQDEYDTKLTLYQVAKYGWIELKNSARSMGEPEPLIHNQIVINRVLVSRTMATFIASYPKLAYATERIANPQDLMQNGVAIGIKGKDVEDVTKVIDYLKPVQISPDAKALNDELTTDTRELSGAGDVSLGLTNPETASGKSIIAVRDNATLPLNIQVSKFKKFVEDLARIWFDMWQNTCGDDGFRVVIDDPDEEVKEIIYGKQDEPEISDLPTYEEKPVEEVPDTPVVKKIPYDLMQKLKTKVRIDVTNSNPYSMYAEEQALEGLLTSGAITFEEYVEALPNNSITPKDKLETILDDREKATEQINAIENSMNAKKQAMEQAIVNQEAQQIAEQPSEVMIGGNADEMQQL